MSCRLFSINHAWIELTVAVCARGVEYVACSQQRLVITSANSFEYVEGSVNHLLVESLPRSLFDPFVVHRSSTSECIDIRCYEHGHSRLFQCYPLFIRSRRIESAPNRIGSRCDSF